MNPAAALVLLFLAIGIAAAGTASAQSNDNSTAVSSNATDSAGNATTADIDDDAQDDVTEQVSSPFVNETSRLVINEVELDPEGSDEGSEWIELYNPTGADIDASDFEIKTSFKSATIQIPSDAVIEANETFVVELDNQILSNTAESLELVDQSGGILDSTPPLVDRSDDSRTWQRIPDGNNEWKFAEGTRDELNEPDGQNNGAQYGERSGSPVCHGTAGCAEGVATRIVDGDTLYVRINATIYKVDLALAGAPSRTEEGFMESTSFTRDLCLGNTVLVDQDDNLLTSETSVIAVVYCASTNLNSELLDSGNAELKTDQCETSEFASERWATDHGC